MSWSSRQKFKITVSFLAVVVLVMVWFIYRLFFSATPTCFDGKQNGPERGVDCGGGCALVCQQDSRPLINLWEQSFEVAPGVYSAVAYFENPNITAGVRDMWYSIEFYNQSLETIDDPVTKRAFVEPGKRSAVFISPRPLSEPPLGVRFVPLTEWVWERPTDLDIGAPVIIESRQLTNVDTQPRLEAMVQNTTLQSQSGVTLVALLYDQQDNAIAASQTVVPTLAPEAVARSVFTWPQAFTADVAGIEILIRQDPFEQQ